MYIYNLYRYCYFVLSSKIKPEERWKKGEFKDRKIVLKPLLRSFGRVSYWKLILMTCRRSFNYYRHAGCFDSNL